MKQNIEELHNKGYTIFKGALKQEQITKALTGYQAICDELDNERVKTLKPNGRNSRLVNSHLGSNDIAKLFLYKPLLDVCDAFFGGRKTSIYTSLFFQEGTKQPLHRDAPVFCTLPESLFLGCWFALEDSKIENGALVGIPGSQKVFHDEYPTRCRIGHERLKESGKIGFTDNESWGQYQTYVKNKCEELGLEPHPIELDAGDVLIWHPLFMHGGLPHTSSRTRQSVVMHVIPEGTEVHGSYLFFSPFENFEPRNMNSTEIPESGRRMKQDVVCFAADRQ